MSRRLPWILLATGLALAAGGFALWRSGPGEPPRASYVGRSTCATCHSRETALWESSDHARAMLPADEKSVLGNFEGARATFHGVTSTFTRKDGRFLIRTDGPDGTLQDFPVKYAFGADPLQQYLIEFSGGRLQALGLCWDARPQSEGGRRWYHLYPEEEKVDHKDVLHWTGLLQNWNYMCAECHSTDLRKNYRAEAGRFETRWSEVNVSCESCHGPGSRHVEWARKPGRERDDDETRGLEVRLKEAVERRWIFDEGKSVARPATLRPARAEVETCGRCHARRALAWEDYRHGRPLADTHRVSLLDEGLYHADGQILDEVYEYGSFLQSRMHRAAVTCSNCHDPHSSRLRLQGNALCGQCHQPAKYDAPVHHRHKPDTPAALCVECHMPSRVYMGVDRRRDHSFRVPRPDLTVTLGTPNACSGCHTDRSASWAAEAIASWTGGKRPPSHYAEAIDAGRRTRVDAERRLVEAADNAEFPPIARGTALSLLPRHLSVASMGGVERGLADPDPLVRQGALVALGAAGDAERLRLAPPLLRDPVRTIRMAAVTLVAGLPRDRLGSAQRRDFDAAAEEYRRSQIENADRPEGHLNLGTLDLQMGRTAEAERAFRKAIEMQPSFVPAHVNLADLFRHQGREREAEETLRRGLAAAPGDADLHYALGLSLARQGRLAEATAELARAADRQANPHYVAAYAGALQDTGDAAGARRLLERVQERFPGDREILTGLVGACRAGGDLRAALDWARKLRELSPDDPEVRRTVEDLERRLR